jgi:hypothetical protein
VEPRGIANSLRNFLRSRVGLDRCKRNIRILCLCVGAEGRQGVREREEKRRERKRERETEKGVNVYTCRGAGRPARARRIYILCALHAHIANAACARRNHIRCVYVYTTLAHISTAPQSDVKACPLLTPPSSLSAPLFFPLHPHPPISSICRYVHLPFRLSLPICATHRT